MNKKSPSTQVIAPVNISTISTFPYPLGKLLPGQVYIPGPGDFPNNSLAMITLVPPSGSPFGPALKDAYELRRLREKQKHKTDRGRLGHKGIELAIIFHLNENSKYRNRNGGHELWEHFRLCHLSWANAWKDGTWKVYMTPKGNKPCGLVQQKHNSKPKNPYQEGAFYNLYLQTKKK